MKRPSTCDLALVLRAAREVAAQRWDGLADAIETTAHAIALGVPITDVHKCMRELHRVGKLRLKHEENRHTVPENHRKLQPLWRGRYVGHAVLVESLGRRKDASV